MSHKTYKPFKLLSKDRSFFVALSLRVALSYTDEGAHFLRSSEATSFGRGSTLPLDEGAHFLRSSEASSFARVKPLPSDEGAHFLRSSEASSFGRGSTLPSPE